MRENDFRVILFPSTEEAAAITALQKLLRGRCGNGTQKRQSGAALLRVTYKIIIDTPHKIMHQSQ